MQVITGLPSNRGFSWVSSVRAVHPLRRSGVSFHTPPSVDLPGIDYLQVCTTTPKYGSHTEIGLSVQLGKFPGELVLSQLALHPRRVPHVRCLRLHSNHHVSGPFPSLTRHASLALDYLHTLLNALSFLLLLQLLGGASFRSCSGIDGSDRPRHPTIDSSTVVNILYDSSGCRLVTLQTKSLTVKMQPIIPAYSQAVG